MTQKHAGDAAPLPPLPPGIRLRPEAKSGAMVACPLDERGREEMSLPRRPLPPLGSGVFEEAHGLCRAAWERRGTCLIVLLLVDLKTGLWQPWVPTQSGGKRGVRCRLRGQKLDFYAPPTMRVAGSVQSLPIDDAHELHHLALPGDGWHGFVDVDFDSPAWWFHLKVGEQRYELPITQALANDQEPLLAAVMNRLRKVVDLDL